MAIVTLRVDDDVEQDYIAFDPNNYRRAMERQLVRYREHSPTSRTVLLSVETRKRIEKAYGKPIESQEEFAKWIENLLAVQVGEISLPLSEGQVKRISGEAKFYASEVKPYLEKRLRVAVDNALGGAL